MKSKTYEDHFKIRCPICNKLVAETYEPDGEEAQDFNNPCQHLCLYGTRNEAGYTSIYENTTLKPAWDKHESDHEQLFKLLDKTPYCEVHTRNGAYEAVWYAVFIDQGKRKTIRDMLLSLRPF